MRRSRVPTLVVLVLAILALCDCGGGGGGAGCTPAALPYCPSVNHDIYFDPSALNGDPCAALALVPTATLAPINWVSTSAAGGQKLMEERCLPPDTPGLVVDPNLPINDAVWQALGTVWVFPNLAAADQASWSQISGSATPAQAAQSFGVAYDKWLSSTPGGGFSWMLSAIQAVEQGQGPQSMQECLALAGVFAKSDTDSRPLILNLGTEIDFDDYKYTVTTGSITAITDAHGNVTNLTPGQYVPVPQIFTDLVPPPSG